MTKQIVPVAPARLNSNIGTEAAHRLSKGLSQAGFTCSADTLEYVELAHCQTTKQHSNVFKRIKQLYTLFSLGNAMLKLFGKLLEVRQCF
ncbi:hypothetical protein D3C75_793800 [compost metagenome]